MLRISERVVVILARKLGADIGAEVGGVHVSAVAMEDGGLEVLLTVRYGVPAAEAADALRRRLGEKLAEHLGRPGPPVNVHITDVHPS